jgi:hypothetical protein
VLCTVARAVATWGLGIRRVTLTPALKVREAGFNLKLAISLHDCRRNLARLLLDMLFTSRTENRSFVSQGVSLHHAVSQQLRFY